MYLVGILIFDYSECKIGNNQEIIRNFAAITLVHTYDLYILLYYYKN